MNIKHIITILSLIFLVIRGSFGVTLTNTTTHYEIDNGLIKVILDTNSSIKIYGYNNGSWKEGYIWFSDFGDKLLKINNIVENSSERVVLNISGDGGTDYYNLSVIDGVPYYTIKNTTEVTTDWFDWGIEPPEPLIYIPNKTIISEFPMEFKGYGKGNGYVVAYNNSMANFISFNKKLINTNGLYTFGGYLRLNYVSGDDVAINVGILPNLNLSQSGSTATDYYWDNWTTKRINNDTLCTQEQADVTSCSETYNNGSYSFSYVNNPGFFIDSDWNSYASFSSTGYVYINYTIPTTALTNSKWHVKTYYIDNYFDLPKEVFNNQILQLRIKFESYFYVGGSGPAGNMDFGVFNGSEWYTLYNLDVDNKDIYEEAMDWNVTSISPPKNYALYYKFDEGSGSVISDYSPNGNNASVNSPATFDNGKSSYAGKTFGWIGSSGGYFESNNNIGITGSDDWTISIWAKPNITSSGSTYGQFIGWGEGNTDKTIGVGVNRVTHHLIIVDWVDDWDTGYVLDNMTWAHIGVTYNGTIQKVYVNGNLIGSRTTNLNLSDSHVFLGKYPFTNDGYYAGLLDEAYIFNRTLSNAEIQALYGQGLPDALSNLESTNYGYTTNDSFAEIFANMSMTEINPTKENITINNNCSYYKVNLNHNLIDNDFFTINYWIPKTPSEYNTIPKGYNISLENEADNKTFILLNGGDNLNYTNCNGSLLSANKEICSNSENQKTLNFTFRDEVSNSIINQSINYYFDYPNNYLNGTDYGNNLLVCLIGDNISNVYSTITYNNESDYNLRYHYLFNLTLTPILKDLTLKNLKSDTSTLTPIQVIDSDSRPVKGVIVVARREYVETNSFESVAMGTTDDNGYTNLYLQWGGVRYDFQILNATSGELIKTTEPTILSSINANPVRIDTSINKVFSVWETLNGIQYNMSLTNNSNIVNATINVLDTSGLMTRVDFECLKRITTGYKLLSSQTIYGTSVSATCEFGNVTNNMYITRTTLYFSNGGQYTFTENYDYKVSFFESKDGIIISIFLLISITMAGIMKGSTAIIFMIIGLMIVPILGINMLKWSNIIPVIISGFIVMIITSRRGYY